MKKILSLVLAAVMVLTCFAALSMTAWADDTTDPNAPTYIWNAEDTSVITPIRMSYEQKGAYNTYSHTNTDPFFFLCTGAEITGDRYISVLYRTSTAGGLSMQFFIGSEY